MYNNDKGQKMNKLTFLFFKETSLPPRFQMVLPVIRNEEDSRDENFAPLPLRALRSPWSPLTLKSKNLSLL